MKLHISKYKKIFLIILFLYPIPYTLYPNHVHAASFDVGIYPPIIQVQTNPKSTIKTPITLENFSDDHLDLNFQIRPFTASNEENGEISYLSATEISQETKLMMQNVHLFDNQEEIKTIALAPRQKKTFSLSLDIPEKALPSDYYLSLIFQTINKQSEKKTNSSIIQAGISTNLLLTVGKTNFVQAEITEFSTPFFLASGPVPFTVRIKNIGKNVMKPIGNILIKNMFGQLIGKIDLLPVNILTNTTRQVPDAISLFSDPKTYTKAIWREKFILGFYSATLILSSDNTTIYTKTIHFSSFPFQPATALVLITILFFLIKNRIQKHM